MALFRALLHEWQLVRHNKAVMLVLFGGILFYAFLYPLPYLHNVAGEQAVVVLNEDKTALSRTLIRRVDAMPQTRVQAVVPSMQEARAMITAGEAQGLLIVPRDFQKDLLLGVPAVLSYAGDASYFLIYGTVVEGLLTAGTTLALEVQALRSVALKEAKAPLVAQIQPVAVSVKPVFNAQAGYLNYVTPAVFVLILQQTMLISLGSVTVLDRQARAITPSSHSIGVALLARFILFVGLYSVFAALYFGFFFKLYVVQAVASWLPLLAFSVLFLGVCALLAMLLGYYYSAPEQSILLVLVSSLPLVFLVGFAWPVTSLPIWLDAAVNLVPARPGILGLLSLNQMGAQWQQMATHISWLLVQGCIFIALLWWRVQREANIRLGL